MSFETEMAQENFLRSGGVFARAIARKIEIGEIPRNYEFHRYPKMLRLSRGEERIERTTEDVKGRTLSWTETKEVFDEIIVHSEEEEERVLAGGRTSVQLEEERKTLMVRARGAGIQVDSTWSVVRLRRELGEALDTPEPMDEMAVLQQKLAHLEEMAAMKDKIAALEAQLAGKPDEAEGLRTELEALGVKVDRRWSVARLREELDRATGAGA